MYFIAAMVVLDYGIKQRGENRVRLLIASVQSHARVLVIHARLDGPVQGESIGRDLNNAKKCYKPKAEWWSRQVDLSKHKNPMGKRKGLGKKARKQFIKGGVQGSTGRREE